MPRVSWSGTSSVEAVKIGRFTTTKLNVVSYAQQYVKMIHSNIFLLQSGTVFFCG